MKTLTITKNKTVKVSDCDYDMLRLFEWNASRVTSKSKNKLSKYGYVACFSKRVNGKKKRFTMHDMIMNPPSGMEVDHKDGDTLNNQRDNLRLVTHRQNCLNRKARSDKKYSKYKGVGFNKGHFRARIRVNDKDIFIGNFDNEFDAAKAYDQKAKEFFGEYAKLNFYE